MPPQGWTELYDWRVDRNDATPLFRQIYLQIRSAILSRAFPPGTKLPSTRALASRLSVARASVVAAYEQLFAEGYLAGKTGSGTYISSDFPEAIDKGPTRSGKRSLSNRCRVALPKRPATELAGWTMESQDRPFNTARMLVDARTVEAWRMLTNRAMRSFGAHHLTYSDPSGFIELRRAICEYLRVARAVRCDPDQIIVTAGSQQALDIATRVLLRPGDEVWIEDPSYPLTYHALSAARMKLCPVPVDAHGMNVGSAIRSASRAAAAVVTSSHQFPTGVVMSMARRLELLDWASKTGAWIIEDDWASEYRYSGRPLASLQGLDDGERVIYLGTLNKTLFPGLRVGYVVPPRQLLGAFVNARYLMDRQPPSLQQIVLAEFMQEGFLAAHIRRIRLRYLKQRDALVAELARRASFHLTVDAPDQGMHLVAYLKDGHSDVEIERIARESGIVVRAMSPLYKKAPRRSALLLGFSGYPPQRLIPAAVRLAAVVQKALKGGHLSC
jgi:GntR family transcriptional regulator/MocR family aminotransferase